jgi:hypothetical protein
MSFLAASLVLLLGFNQTQVLATDPVWERLQPTLLRIDLGGVTTGHAVLIDPDGLFLAAKSAVPSPSLVGWRGPSQPVPLERVAIDETTQLVLLRARDWSDGPATSVRILATIEPGTRLIVVTSTGPVRAEFVSADRIGVVRPSLRSMPLAEVRLESAVGQVGGAPVFTESGALAGILGATLSTERPILTPVAPRAERSSGIADSTPAALYGPQGLTVAYALTPPVIQRVVLGFLSPDREVLHPSIGVFYRATSEGVVLEVVMPGSPAAQAGLKAGDLILAANGTAVRSPVDFARVLFQAKVGDKIRLTVRSGGSERSLEVTVGVQDSLS